MANQSPDRRRVLETLAKAAIASQFPGFSRWIFAAEHAHPDKPIHTRTANYQPQFFSASEYRAIRILTDLIIPADDSPGAEIAGVSEFIDFMAAHGDEDLSSMRTGLQWLDAKANAMGARTFAELSASQQGELLTSAASRQGEAQGQAFFKLVRRFTVMGYYTSRVGLEQLGYPGLEFYTHSPECPHTDDPEHRNLAGSGI